MASNGRQNDVFLQFYQILASYRHFNQFKEITTTKSVQKMVYVSRSKNYNSITACLIVLTESYVVRITFFAIVIEIFPVYCHFHNFK